MMMSSPNIVGLRTSMAASRTISARDRPVRSSARWRAEFSTEITELSTISPKSIAPRLMRVPAIPARTMRSKAKRSESGMAAATISPARTFPRKTKRTAMTSSAPSKRFLRTVCST